MKMKSWLPSALKVQNVVTVNALLGYQRRYTDQNDDPNICF